MKWMTNGFVGLVNLLILILSIPIIFISLRLYLNSSSTECERMIGLPLLALGVFLALVSLLGFIGSCCRVSFLLCIYLMVMFVLVLGLFVFTAFAIAVTNEKLGEVISRQGYKDHRLGDYTNWIQNHVIDGDKWNKIKSCLVEANVCKIITDTNDVHAHLFLQKKLSQTQSGCCQPPTECGFIYKNATLWEKPKSNPSVLNSDCTTWSNNKAKLCYDCKSCKAGVLFNLKKNWRKLAVINASILLFLLIIYSVGCCALRNNRNDAYKKRRLPPI